MPAPNRSTTMPQYRRLVLEASVATGSGAGMAIGLEQLPGGVKAPHVRHQFVEIHPRHARHGVGCAVTHDQVVAPDQPAAGEDTGSFETAFEFPFLPREH